MHFLIWETLSFNLMYVTACYPVGTTISKTSSLFTALLQHYIYNMDILRQSACLLINPKAVYSYSFHFNCTVVGQASNSMIGLT